MSEHAGQSIEENAHYSITSDDENGTLVFSWKPVAGLGIRDMQDGIATFAGQCKLRKPAQAVIDARKLDPDSPARAWVSSQKTFPGQEDYGPWWSREIVPVYNDAGIASLAVATGDPNAPGEIASAPPGVTFKMGFFPNLDAAMRWRVD
ncbi:MAG: hypothetical protein ACR2QH_06000 [Geminicoccaceae bacterium]